MYSTVQTLSERLVGAKMALTNALSEEDIKNALSELGFDEAKLLAGMDLYKKTEELYQMQRSEYTEQFLASEALHKAWEEAKLVYRKHATVAKLSLMDEATLKGGLGLNNGRKFAIADWITQARTFYITALQSSAILARLAEFSINEEKLQAGLQMVDTVEELNGRREIEKAEAQQATRERDASFVQLDIYMYKFNKVAPLVLVEKPEHLEKVGILKRSAPIRKPKTEGEEPEETADDTGVEADVPAKGAGAEKM